ncbi:spore germination protein [Cytobacillus firmus]|uniref:GerAB/ArcD/ProY family transporter n=1 Tax=Cytobacillus firmus TaxID=1399 RepID=UPI00216110B2|nr:spore germination protein [Cytobacillus firmus]MCS0669946.1 spore germination protein [Cytobacillus firmus]
MEKIEGKIGGREFIAIIILTVGTKLADDTPAILYEKLGNAAWMAPIIIGMIWIIPLYFLVKVISLYEGKSLIDIIKKLFGKYMGFIILFLLWVIHSYAIIIDTAIYTDIIGTMYFTKTPALIIYVLLMAVSAYGAKKGLEHIGSFAWSVLLWIKISAFAALIMIYIQGEIHFIFPIFGPGQWEIMKESTANSSLFTDFVYFSLIAPLIKSSKDYKKWKSLGFVFVILELTVALFGFVLVFDYIAVKMMNYPFHEAIRYIQFGFLTNVEMFIFPFWLLSTFVRFAVYLYLCALLFGGLFNIKQIEYIIPTLATLFIFIGMMPETPTFTIFNLRQNFLHLITPFFIGLPFVLWITAKLRGEFKK